MNFLSAIWKYKQVIIGAVLVLFLGLYVGQINETKKVKAKLEMTQRVAEQNIAALKDSSIQLQVTKQQLGAIDSNLKNALVKVDSIGKIKSKVIILTQPIYLGKDLLVPSTLLFDTAANKYGLKFSSTDMVRTINGVSWFKLKTDQKTLTVIPDSTKINDFKLNFALVISQYDDQATKFTRTKIIPFNVNTDGSIGNQIPDSLLSIKFRNAEILDKPFTIPETKSPEDKRLLRSGWGVTLNPAAVGIYPVAGGLKYGWTPNIGFGYFITLRRK